MGVESHGDSQLGVGGAVSPQPVIGVVVEEGTAALELVRNLGRRDDGGVGVDLLGLRADNPNQVLSGQELAKSGDRVSFVALGVSMGQIQLPSQDATGI